MGSPSNIRGRAPDPRSRSLREIVLSSGGVVVDDSYPLFVDCADGQIRGVDLRVRLLPGELDELARNLEAEIVEPYVLAARIDGRRAERILASLVEFEDPIPLRLHVMTMKAPFQPVAVDVDVRRLASFLNEVGRSAADANHEDVQFSTAWRDPVASERVWMSGFVADIDELVADPAMEPANQSATLPVAAFSTEHGGARFVYAFTQAIASDDRRMMSKREDFIDEIALAHRGFDPSSEKLSQRQYVPTLVRTTKGPRRRVERAAVQVSSHRIDLERYKFVVPRRIRTLLGVDEETISNLERVEVTEYLEAIGMPAPRPGASELYSRCPLKVHSERKAYVNVDAEGRITVCCLGGHGGLGRTMWSERELLERAREVLS